MHRWNDFRCSGISAANVMKVADKMAELDLASVGYEYINIDDCWAVSRDSTTGKLVPDPTAFPDGMKSVADYVHGKGFKFGIYTECVAGLATTGYPFNAMIADRKFCLQPWNQDLCRPSGFWRTRDNRCSDVCRMGRRLSCVLRRQNAGFQAL